MNTKLMHVRSNPQLTATKLGSAPRWSNRTSVIGTLALATCLLGQPARASLSDPVTRPVLIIEGHLTITVDPVTGAYTFTDWGWATHTGLYSNSGSSGPGGLDLVTGEFISGSGVVIAANGDTADWEIGNTPDMVVYTGGTGIFQGVTGGFTAIVTSVTPLSFNPDGTVTLAITYTGSGTITY